MEDDVNKEKLGNYSIKVLKRMAVDRHSGSLGYAEAMLICYKKKMKYGLKWGDLYSAKGRKPESVIKESDTDQGNSESTPGEVSI